VPSAADRVGPRLLVVLSEPDPVARAVDELWGTGAATGEHVDGAAVRRFGDGLTVVRRPVRHIQDERLDLRLPPSLRAEGRTLAFPSVHRSVSGTRCFTVHPLGNPGSDAELGGRPRTFVPTDARAMAGVLRSLREAGGRLGVPSTYEATHHGPLLTVPAFFVEIAHPDASAPRPEEVAVLADALRSGTVDPSDRVALGAGGGHYAPRFTDLAIARRWAFGHLLSRHALADLDPATARGAWDATVGAEGIVFARAQDRALPAFAGVGAELRETDAARRGEASEPSTSAARPASGT